MFKIKGKPKNYFLKIGSEIQIYDTVNRLWYTYIVKSIKFTKVQERPGVEVHYFGIQQFSKQLNEIYLCRESHIAEHIDQNLLRIIKR